MYNVAKLSSNRTGGNSAQVETENEKFTAMCSCCPQNLKFGHFSLSVWPSTETKCTKIQNARARPIVLLIKSYCFVTFSLPSPSWFLKVVRCKFGTTGDKSLSIWHGKTNETVLAKWKAYLESTGSQPNYTLTVHRFNSIVCVIFALSATRGSYY